MYSFTADPADACRGLSTERGQRTVPCLLLLFQRNMPAINLNGADLSVQVDRELGHTAAADRSLQVRIHLFQLRLELADVHVIDAVPLKDGEDLALDLGVRADIQGYPDVIVLVGDGQGGEVIEILR